jgi:hypothetical protein
LGSAASPLQQDDAITGPRAAPQDGDPDAAAGCSHLPVTCCQLQPPAASANLPPACIHPCLLLRLLPSSPSTVGPSAGSASLLLNHAVDDVPILQAKLCTEAAAAAAATATATTGSGHACKQRRMFMPAARCVAGCSKGEASTYLHNKHGCSVCHMPADALT